MTMRDVKSSNIKAIGYDEGKRILRVQFNNGSYDFPDVSPHQHQAFLASDSKGTFFSKHIRPLKSKKV